MAEKSEGFHDFGYPDEQFETVLSENLHCGICSCVFKDPVMCKNEHCFCRGCITQHLQNSQTCPSCKQDLTVDSLSDAPRILRNLLSEQRIRCDYHERGCQEIVQLGKLANHVAVCGKAPVMCSNEECSSEINREDLLRHESEECRYRELKCRNCKEMSSMVQEIETRISCLSQHVQKLDITGLNTSINELKTGFTAMENRLGELESHFANKEDLGFKIVRRNKDGECNRCDEATAVKSSSKMKDLKSQSRSAYLVAGGYGEERKPINSAEIYDKAANAWIRLKPMKMCHADASSVSYDGQVLVTGGTSDGNNTLSDIEHFRKNPNPLVPACWSNFPVNLPKPLRGHYTVVHEGRVIVIGYDDGDRSTMFYEIQLHFPFNTKVLAKCRLERPIAESGVVLVNDKIFFFGGCKGNKYSAIANVTMYDISKNEFKEIAPLPYPVRHMAAVQFEDNVVLVGGLGNHYSPKNTVVSYNLETQKSIMLKPMTEYLSQCSAVVDGNSMVMMGGRNQGCARLMSVKAFDFKSSEWRTLRSMNEERSNFIAEIV